MWLITVDGKYIKDIKTNIKLLIGFIVILGIWEFILLKQLSDIQCTSSRIYLAIVSIVGCIIIHLSLYTTRYVFISRYARSHNINLIVGFPISKSVLFVEYGVSLFPLYIFILSELEIFYYKLLVVIGPMSRFSTN